eukprot:TRINITY_DN20299_c3_g1_i1.p1 TRINITY_DN20299_c3_g1~~TRINITY_DN20299_c3_g1_i1.p1  ORF type:complete len:526 (-),score=108.67 TRINITY_DN20299_c3_g1_i1:291-1868(-)
MSPSLHVAGADAFGSTPCISAVSRLASSFGQLLLEDGCVETRSEVGLKAAMAFMKSLAEAAAELGLEPASRSYRANFTIKYRARFPKESRDYQLDILEASLQKKSIWLNGDRFELSAETMTCAETLKRLWAKLVATLTNSENNTESQQAKLERVLSALDSAWAAFENAYINDLISIEAEPIKLIITAIENEQRLEDLEAKHDHHNAVFVSEFMDAQKKLVENLAHLNMLCKQDEHENEDASFRWRDRDDLAVDILWDAMEKLQCCNTAVTNGDSSEPLQALQSCCGDVVDSFLAVRKYLRGVSTCLEQVDPHLRNNVGLVERLLDWEESWALGKNYIQNGKICDGVMDLVAGIRLAQGIMPDLRRMCEECDEELFTLLPSLIWLRGLAEPAAHLDVFRHLLPHRFTGIREADNNSQEQWPCDPDLKAFFKKFHSTSDLLLSGGYSAGRSSDSCAWKVLVKRVVLGSEGGSGGDAFGILSPSARFQAEQAMESFVHEMERWNFEIQTHCARDWNLLMSVIISIIGK